MSDLQIIPETHPESLANIKKTVLPMDNFVGKSIPKKEESPQITTPQGKEVLQLHTSKEKTKPRSKEALPQKQIFTPKSGELALGNPNQQRGGQQATTVQQVLSKIAGYQSSQTGINQSFINDPTFPQNLFNYTSSGNPSDASLWQATLLVKVWKAWQLVFGH